MARAGTVEKYIRFAHGSQRGQPTSNVKLKFLPPTLLPITPKTATSELRTNFPPARVLTLVLTIVEMASENSTVRRKTTLSKSAERMVSEWCA
jgi:hypothetical protein